MTTAEITAFVMALSPKEIRRRAAEDVMGWHTAISHTGKMSWQGPGIAILLHTWHPSTDRNQSRQVVLKVADANGPDCIVDAMYDVTKDHFYAISSADQESRAALIAHYTSKGGIE